MAPIGFAHDLLQLFCNGRARYLCKIAHASFIFFSYAPARARLLETG